MRFMEELSVYFRLCERKCGWNLTDPTLRGSAHCRRPRIFGFLDFLENVDFWNFPVGFGVWGGLAIDWKWLWDSNRWILSPN